MKKLISILAVLAILSTSVFAAGVTVLNDTSYEDILLFEESFGSTTKSEHGSLNVDNKSKEVITFDGNVATIAVDPNKVPVDTSVPGYRAVVYNADKYSKPSGNFLGIQYDIAFSGLEEVPAGKQVLYTPLGTANLTGTGSWKFGTDYPAFRMEEVGEEGAKETKLFFGDVEFDTTKFNTVSLYLNYENYTYTAYLNDTKLAKTYKFNEAFTEFHKIEYSVNDSLEDVVLKIDNIKVYDNPSKESSLQVIMNGEELEVDSEGNVTFGAILPKGFGSAKAYLNDIELDVDIAEISGAAHNSYKITAAIPDGVAYGEGTLKLVSGENSVSKKIKLNKNVEVVIARLTSTATDGREQKMLLPERAEGGKYRIHFDFSVTDAVNFRLGLRLCPDTGKGNGTYFGNVTAGGRNLTGGSNAWAYWSIDKLQTNGATIYTNGDLNSADMIIDYHGPNDNNRPYQIIINGELAIEGTHTLADSASFNGFVQFGYNSTGSSAPQNIVIYEQFGYPDAREINVNYTNGHSEVYAGEKVTSVALDNVIFTLDQELSNTDGNVKFVDSEGVEVQDVKVSIEGKEVCVDYTGNSVLDSGIYKLVIGKDVVAKSEVVGAEVEIPIEFSANDSILPIAYGTDGKVTLSAYAKDADKVLFYIDGQLIEEISGENAVNNIYKKEYLPTEGEHTFDVYTVKGSDIEVVSSMFTYNAGYAKKGYSEYNRTGAIDVGKSKDLTESTRRFPGRVVFEVDLTIPEKGDRVYFELGGATKYDYVYAGDGYKTLVDAIGYDNSAKALFNENGTIAETGIPYPVNEEFTLKYVCDSITDTYEVYINGELVATKVSTYRNSTDGSLPLANMAVVGCKIRLTHKDTNGNGAGAPIVGAAKVRTWQEFVTPVLSAVACGGEDIATENGYIAIEGSEDITLTFDKAYNALDNTLVTVLVNGVAKEAGISYSKEAKTLTVSGVERKAGDIVKVLISKDATMDVDSVELVDGKNAQAMVATAVGKELETVIYTADENGLWFNGLNSVKNGNTAIVYTKYINGGEAKEGNMLLGTWASANRYSSVDYKGVTFDAATTGLVSISGTVGAKWNANLWDANYQTLTESIGE